MAGIEAFLISFGINFVIFLVLMGLFGFLRPRFPDVFQPRANFLPDGAPPLPALPPTFFGWIRPLFSIPETTFINLAGLDAVMFLRFLGFGMKFFGGCALFGLVLTLPLNVTGGDADRQSETFDELDLLSLGNIESGSDRFWAHLLAAYLYSFYLFYLLNNVYADYVDLRQRFFGKTVKCESFSLLVREVPKEERTDAGIREYFSGLYHDDFQGAQSVAHTADADKMIKEHAKMVRKLERAWVNFEKKGERPEHKTGALGIVGEKVDSINFYSDELKRLRGEIEDALRETKPTPSGFVSFTSVATTQTAAQTTHNRNPFVMMVQAAPEPADVLWGNLGLELRERLLREMLKSAAIFWLVVYWSIPVAFAASLGNLSGLAEEYSFLSFVNDLDPATIGLLEGILPSVFLIVLMAILPIVLKALAVFAGLPSSSLVEQAVMSAYFYFQVFNVFLVTSLASSASSSPSALIDDPIGTLGTTIPRTAVLFTNYILMEMFVQYPTMLLQVGPLIMIPLMRKYVAKTERDRKDVVKPKPFKYGTLYPKLLLTFILGLTYSTMYPVILPIAAMSFTIAYIGFRYLLMYVFSTPYESSGAMWPLVFNRICTGTLIHHLTLIGVLAIKEAPLQSVLLFPLVAFTLAFRNYANGRYFPAVRAMSLEDAQMVDRKQKQAEGQKQDLDHASNYTVPSFDWLPEIPEIPADGLPLAGYDHATIAQLEAAQRKRAAQRKGVVETVEYPDDVLAWDDATVTKFLANVGTRVVSGVAVAEILAASNEEGHFNDAELGAIESELRDHFQRVRPESLSSADPDRGWLTSIGMPDDLDLETVKARNEAAIAEKVGPVRAARLLELLPCSSALGEKAAALYPSDEPQDGKAPLPGSPPDEGAAGKDWKFDGLKGGESNKA